MTVSGQFSCPPAGSFVAVSGQFLVAADTSPPIGPRLWPRMTALQAALLNGRIRSAEELHLGECAERRTGHEALKERVLVIAPAALRDF